MRIQLVSHASVLIECRDACIWTDPWLLGKAFNDSWSLYPEPAWDPAWLDRIDTLWISHEHPDHFNLPTLRSLPEAFKRRVTVLFQANNSRKMFEAFERLGFPNHRALPHRARVQIAPDTEVYCHQLGNMDSALGVRSGDRRIIDINDALATPGDCRRMRRDFGAPDLVLNQFAVAGYGGLPHPEVELPKMSEQFIRFMLDNHRDLGAARSLPFASFIVFSCQDNRYVNAFKATPADVHARFQAAGQPLVVLYPGDGYEVGADHDPAPALARFRESEARLADFVYDAPGRVEPAKLASAFAELHARIRARYPAAFLARLAPVVLRIPDLRLRVRFGIADGLWQALPEGDWDDADLEVGSQALHHALSLPFGFQTLGVSARFAVLRNPGNWRRHRLLFSLHNAEIYLKPSLLLTRANLRHLWARRRGLWGQIGLRLSLQRRGF